MPLAAGSRLGPYEIVAPLGAGAFRRPGVPGTPRPRGADHFEPVQFPHLHAVRREGNARLSPDGKWLAYLSDESGRNEVYVQRFRALEAGALSVVFHSPALLK
jgi:hypothetical protein